MDAVIVEPTVTNDVRVRKPELAEFPYSYIHHLCLFFLSLDAEQDRDGTR